MTYRQVIHKLRLVIPAMAVGIAVFVAVALTAAKPSAPAIDAALLTTTLLVFAPISAAVAIVFGSVFSGQLRARVAAVADQAARDAILARGYFTASIVPAALAEGVALFAAVSLMMTHQKWLLVIVGVALVAVIGQFPTATRLRDFVERLTGELRYEIP